MWRCKTCHSTAVEGLSWVDLNARHKMDEVEDQQEHWCRSCDARVEVYFKNEPDEADLPVEEDDDYVLDDDGNFLPDNL